MRLWILIVIAGVALLSALPAAAQPLPAPCEIRIYQDNPGAGVLTTWGPGLSIGYRGISNVSKQFQCPVPQCRYSSSVPGNCANPLELDLPGLTAAAHLAVPLVNLAATPAQRFLYSHGDPPAPIYAGGLPPVIRGLTRPFHPGEDNDPNTVGPGGQSVRIQVVQQSGGLLALTETGGYRLRIMPPGVLKPRAMSWVDDPIDPADDDVDMVFAVNTGAPPPARTPVGLIDIDDASVPIPVLGSPGWFKGFENGIMANPATCPTARWTISFGEQNGVEEAVGGGGWPDWFTLYRGDRDDGSSDGWGFVNSSTPPNVWVSFSEEIAFTFDLDELHIWMDEQLNPGGGGPTAGGDPSWFPGPPPWLPGPPPWAAGQQGLTITFDTYSNCVYLPYPGLDAPAYPDGPDNFFIDPGADGTAGTPDDVAPTSIQDVNDPANPAADHREVRGFVYEPRIGEVGLGRVDLQERINQGNDPGGLNPIYAWRPYDVDRDATGLLPLPAADASWVFVEDTGDLDGDGRLREYFDRGLHAFFFCSRQEIDPAPAALARDDPLDPLMPLLTLTPRPALPGTTVAASFPLGNQAEQQVLKCRNCGAVHPTDDPSSQHPIAPTAATPVPPNAVDHSQPGLGNYCEFCGTQLERLTGLDQLGGDTDADDPGDQPGPKTTEPNSADVALAEFGRLRTATPTFSRASMGPTVSHAEIPFENVLFGPLTLDPLGTPISVRSVPVNQTVAAALGVSIPYFQPPSSWDPTLVPPDDADPYRAVALLYEAQDERNRWYYEAGSWTATNPMPPALPTAVGHSDVAWQFRQPRTGAAAVQASLAPPPIPAVTEEHVLFDNNGTWDTYYTCPDCGSKQSSLVPLAQYDLDNSGVPADPDEIWRGCLHVEVAAGPTLTACLGHAFCPLHGARFAPGAAGQECTFWRAIAAGPNYISGTPTNTAEAGPNALLDEANLTAEEYEPIKYALSVDAQQLARVVSAPVHFGDVAPGTVPDVNADGNAEPHGALNTHTYPQEVSPAVPLPIENIGNVAIVADPDTSPVIGVAIRFDGRNLRHADGPPGVSGTRQQQGVPINVGAQPAAAPDSMMQAVDHFGRPLPARRVFSMMPAYPGDPTGSRLAYHWPSSEPQPAPGPAGIQAGISRLSLADPNRRPIANGTPMGEYAGGLTAYVNTVQVPGDAQLRARVVESRVPADSTVNSPHTDADASPSVAMAPGGPDRDILVAWTSNEDPTGGGGIPGPDSPQNIWNAGARGPIPPPGDPFYDHRPWLSPEPVPAGPIPPEVAPNAFHVKPFALLTSPTQACLYWHTQQRNPGLEQWQSSVGVRLADAGGDGILGTADDGAVAQYAFNVHSNQRGLRAIALRENPTRHCLLWHSDEEGQQRIGFNPMFDPTSAVATIDGYFLRLSNARLGSAEPKAIVYDNLTGPDPLAVAQAAFDPDGDGVPNPLVRKPASDPFIFTKDPWVAETPLTGPARLQAFYAAGLRHQRNSDICWSMFDAYQDADADGLADDLDGDGVPDPLPLLPQRNYGKIAFPRLDVSNGKHLLPLNPAISFDTRLQLGEKLQQDGKWQTFTSRHLDWVTTPYYPMPPFVDPDDGGYWGDLQARALATWQGTPNVDPRIYVVLIVNTTVNPYADASTYRAQQWDPTVPGPVLVDPAVGPPAPLTWDPFDREGNRYDERRGLSHITPLNLPPDPTLSGTDPITVIVDQSSGVVKFSQPLFNEHDPADDRAVFSTANVPGLVRVEVWLDYQPFTYRITTDGNADESPAAIFDAFGRLALFWQRKRSVAAAGEQSATTLMYKTYSTGIQVLRPPIDTAQPVQVEARDPLGAWRLLTQGTDWDYWPAGTGDFDGVIRIDPAGLEAATRADLDGDGTPDFPGASLPARVRVRYDDIPRPPGLASTRTEQHRLVGWSKEMRAPMAAVVSEEPVSVAGEVYQVDTTGGGIPGSMDIVKYWLFWSSTRGLYTPAPGTPPPPGAGLLTGVPASDLYYGVVAPAFGSAVPE